MHFIGKKSELLDPNATYKMNFLYSDRLCDHVQRGRVPFGWVIGSCLIASRIAVNVPVYAWQ